MLRGRGIVRCLNEGRGFDVNWIMDGIFVRIERAYGRKEETKREVKRRGKKDSKDRKIITNLYHIHCIALYSLH